MKNITKILLLMLAGIIFSCSEWVLPEACNEPTPTEITLNNVGNTINCTVGSSSATWVVKNIANTTVKFSSGSVNTFSFGATGEFPPGDYTITASGTTACGFRFDIPKKYTVICTGSNPTDISFVQSVDKLTTVCTLISTDNLIGDTWTLIDKVSPFKRFSIVNGTSTNKVTLNIKDYPSSNYTLEVKGKTKCGTDFTYTPPKDFKVDYFDLLDFKIPSNIVGLSGLNTKVGINGDIYLVGTSDNTAYLLKYNKYGTFTSSTVLATISTQRTGGSSITVNDVKIDNNDNIYITGNSKHSLGPSGPGASFGTFQTIQGFFVAKYNASGVAQWAKGSNMLQTTSGNSLSVAPDGSVYVIGDFSGNSLSVGSHEPVSAVGKNDIFVVKYNQNGIFTWISTIGGTDNDSGKGIVTSSNGDVYLAGYSSDLLSLKFNKSASIIGSKFGGNDILIMKLDRFSGVPSWIRTEGGEGNDIANSITIDENSNLYCTGTVSSSATFGNRSVGASGLNSLFLAKYNLSGDVIWATSGSSTGFTITSDQVIVDATGNVFLKGVFVNDLTIKTLSKKSSNNNFDGYVAKFSTVGDIQWLESIGGTGNDYASGIVFDNNKNIFITIFSDAGFTLGGTDYPANRYLWRLDK